MSAELTAFALSVSIVLIGVLWALLLAIIVWEAKRLYSRIDSMDSSIVELFAENKSDIGRLSERLAKVETRLTIHHTERETQ